MLDPNENSIKRNFVFYEHAIVVNIRSGDFDQFCRFPLLGKFNSILHIKMVLQFYGFNYVIPLS